MLNLSNLCFRAAFLFFAVGVSMGLAMSVTQDFLLRPVHVHVNLLGWVNFALYGAVYRFFPEVAVLRAAKIQVASAILGLPVMMTGLALVLFGVSNPGLLLLFAGEFLTAVGVAVFVVLGFIATRSEAKLVQRSEYAVPAE
jgi:hypothetical protein